MSTPFDRPVVLTSWWRDPVRNREVGGSDESQHLIGTAADFVTPEPAALARALRAAGLVAVLEPSHVHVQLAPASARLTARVLRSFGGR